MSYLNVYIYVKIAASVPMDIMPGPNDPANFALPQQVSFNPLTTHFVCINCKQLI